MKVELSPVNISALVIMVAWAIFATVIDYSYTSMLVTSLTLVVGKESHMWE